MKSGPDRSETMVCLLGQDPTFTKVTMSQRSIMSHLNNVKVGQLISLIFIKTGLQLL